MKITDETRQALHNAIRQVSFSVGFDAREQIIAAVAPLMAQEAAKEIAELRKLDTYEVGYRDGESSCRADIDVAREQSEEIGYANGYAEAENAARLRIEALEAALKDAYEVLKVHAPVPQVMLAINACLFPR